MANPTSPGAAGLSAGQPHLFFVNCLSLPPGTLSADIENVVMVLHVPDMGTDVVP